MIKKIKEEGKFKPVKQFKVHKTAITFKINIRKLIDKYPKLMEP